MSEGKVPEHAVGQVLWCRNADGCGHPQPAGMCPAAEWGEICSGGIPELAGEPQALRSGAQAHRWRPGWAGGHVECHGMESGACSFGAHPVQSSTTLQGRPHADTGLLLASGFPAVPSPPRSRDQEFVLFERFCAAKQTGISESSPARPPLQTVT